MSLKVVIIMVCNWNGLDDGINNLYNVYAYIICFRLKM